MSIADEIMTRIRRNAAFFAHVGELSKKATADNIANKPLQADVVRGDKNREELSQRAFVRKFGDKVKSVRYSDRADFVGMMVLGRFSGFWITQEKGVRRLRVIEVDGPKMQVTNRYIPLRSSDSLSNLQRGLLTWVR